MVAPFSDSNPPKRPRLDPQNAARVGGISSQLNSTLGVPKDKASGLASSLAALLGSDVRTDFGFSATFLRYTGGCDDVDASALTVDGFVLPAGEVATKSVECADGTITFHWSAPSCAVSTSPRIRIRLQPTDELAVSAAAVSRWRWRKRPGLRVLFYFPLVSGDGTRRSCIGH